LEEDLRMNKEVGSGGAGELFAADIINPEIIDKFDTKFVVVKYLKRNSFFLFLSFFSFI